MRPIYYETQLVGNAQQFDIEVQSLLRAAGLDGAEVAEALNCDALNTLKIELATRGVTGLQLLDTDTEKACHYAIEDNVCSINVSGLAIGHYYVTIKAIYGTHTRVLCTIFFDVVTEADEHTEPIVIQMPVVSTITPDMSGVALEATSQEIKAAIMPLSDAAEAYNVGKTQLAAAITSKGVETSPTESYPEMAEKVNAISQETYEIDGGEMYAKQLFGSLETPNYWNLYDVLTQLLSDGRLVNYGGILLAEYYKGYASLALSGAGAGGAYVVSDKDSDGNFIMYTNDTTHTWATEFDGKGNRWVAYCFADEYHDFEITNEGTSPRKIFIGRKVGKIQLLANSRTSQVIVPDGNSLKGIPHNSYTCSWDKTTVFRNMSFDLSSGVIKVGTGVNELAYFEFDNAEGDPNNFISAGSSLNSIIVAANSIKGNYNPGTGYGALVRAESNTIGIYYADSITGALQHGGKEVIIIADTITRNNGKLCYYTNYLKHIYIGYKSPTNGSIEFTIGTQYNVNNLVVELKDGFCKPFTFTEELTETNIYTYILQRLKQDEPDCGDGVTITLGSTNLAKLTSAESVQLLDDLTNIYGYTFA